MDDPTLRCENDTGNETRLPGLPNPSGGPKFFEPPRGQTRPAARSINFSGYRDVRLAEHVRHLRFLQPRSIIFEG